MIKRDLLNSLVEHLFHEEISLIVGPRQAGRTTLMLMLKNYLETNKEKTLYLNLDNEIDKSFFVSQIAFIKKVELELGKDKGFVFIDEIQRSLRSFITKYQPTYALIINLSLKQTVNLEKTKVIFLPYWQLLKDNIKSIWEEA